MGSVTKIGSDAHPYYEARVPLGSNVRALITAAFPSGIVAGDWYWMPKNDHIRVAFRTVEDADHFGSKQ